jgi:hypothetical protein
MSNPMQRVDVHSATWRLVVEYSEARLAELRTRLEGMNLGWEDTQCVRAQMRELRLLLSSVQSENSSFDQQEQEA